MSSDFLLEKRNTNGILAFAGIKKPVNAAAPELIKA
jgi:hypothetical protein